MMHNPLPSAEACASRSKDNFAGFKGAPEAPGTAAGVSETCSSVVRGAFAGGEHTALLFVLFDMADHNTKGAQRKLDHVQTQERTHN